MKALITLRDEGDAIAVDMIYLGTIESPGFSAGSHAHQHALLVMKILDQLAVKLTETGKLVPIAEEELPGEIRKAIAAVEAQEALGKGELPSEIDNPEYYNVGENQKIKTPTLYVVKH